MPDKKHKVAGKKSVVSAWYEYGMTPSLFDLDFSVKVTPNSERIFKEFGDTKSFKYEWLRKNFTERAFASRLRDVKISGFDIPFVTFSTQFDEDTINPKKSKPIKFKITVTIEADDDDKVYSADEFKKVVETAVKKIEPKLLEDNEYLTFSK